MPTWPRCSATPPSSRERTGLALDIQILDSDTYFSNAIQDRLAEGGADVFMSGPGAALGARRRGPRAAAGRVRRPGLGRLGHGRFHRRRCSPRIAGPGASATRSGAGPLLEIPVNCESYNLTYVPEHLERHGLELPTTWEAYFVDRRELVRRSGGGLRGFGQRGKEAWHTMYTGYATQIWSSGGRDFDDDLRCAIADAGGRRADRAPRRGAACRRAAVWTEQRWYELALDFAAGELRIDRRLRPLRRDLRGSRRSRASPGRSPTPARRPAPPARSFRTSGRGRWS